MALTYKALSALLSYPGPELQAAADGLRGAIEDEAMVSRARRRDIDRLIDEIASSDLYDLQERYVDLFDRSRALSLHLFEHVHGESRDRGQAMIDLKNVYEEGGLFIDGGELPDYLPLFLEFLSTRPPEEARDLLAQAAHIVAALAERLEKRASPYAAVLAALGDMAPGASADAAVAEAPDIDPGDLDALDAAWEDEPVSFGPDAAPGCKDELIAKLRAAKRSASGGMAHG